MNLGSGLDARFFRVDNGRILWFDIDLPDAMAVRQRFFKEDKRVRQIASSILEPQWTERIPKGRPLLFLIEGVLMYFTEEQVKKTFKLISTLVYKIASVTVAAMSGAL
ncbi:MAG: class I SAM-dependent methyltransferase [Clostridiales bacterium]|nr:class I SAM-dependent methyltransferase [Clostridiales bacterium]